MVLPKFRFAPSPNGFLHLGHAHSALLNDRLAREAGGAFLLRIEDIDSARCTPAFDAALREDLHWLGLTWPEPARRQSAHLDAYRDAQADLHAQGLLYPCFCTRGDILRTTSRQADWPRDPDGAPLYPGTCKGLDPAARATRMTTDPHAWRLDMRLAVAQTGDLVWTEVLDSCETRIAANPVVWGDVIVARKDIGTSYHIAVVVDDALQGITQIVRGRDLFAATAVHRVLQTLLGLPAPRYRHHALLLDAAGDKLAKSRASTPLRVLRDRGSSPHDVRAMAGFS